MESASPSRERRVRSGEKPGTGFGGVILKEGLFPSSHQSEEGGLRDQEDVAKPPNRRSRGGVPLSSENHPVLAKSRSFATFFLIARTPLLAMMQGGEYTPG